MESEGNPWPSFVDTFSIMLCIFIFVMLIFVINNIYIAYDSARKVYSTIAIKEESKNNINTDATTIPEAILNDINTAQPTDSDTSDISDADEVTRRAEAELSVNAPLEPTEQAELDHNNSETAGITRNDKGSKARKEEQGRFDKSLSVQLTFTELNGKLVISYNQPQIDFSPEDWEKIINWIRKRKGNNFNVEMEMAQGGIAFSDALRIGYEQSVLLMRDLKSSNSKLNIKLSVSVNELVTKNTITIYPSEE